MQVGYTDRLLGRFIRRLRAVGLWDQALVVVGPDHGISFRAGDLRRDPTRTNLSELAFIPFFMKLPGQKQGRIVDTHISIVDILPTIADAHRRRDPVGDGWTFRARGDGGPSGRAGRRTSRRRTPRPSRSASARSRGRSHTSAAARGTVASPGREGSERSSGDPWLRCASRRQRDGEAFVDGIGSKLLRSLPKRSPLFPSPLSGYFRRVGNGGWVALALNGRIAAVSHTYESGGKLRFSLLASDTAFRAGRNAARMFVVSGATANPQLRELRVKLSSLDCYSFRSPR